MVAIIDFFNQLITENIMAYYADGTFLILAIAAFVYLYVTCEELRYKFLLPIFLMLFITVNPILYKFIFIKIIYWRLFWMLPTTVLIAAAVVMLLKRQTKVWMKWGILVVAAAIIISQGQYMFSYGVFLPRSNWEKLSQETIDVCDIMLELDETPRAIMPETLFVEIRQYAPEISMMYGRDVHNYIRHTTIDNMNVFNTFKAEEPNYMFVLSYARESLYNFIVVEEKKEFPLWALEVYGYQEIGRTEESIIYYNVGL